MFPEVHSGVKIEICNFESSVLLEQGPGGGNPRCFAVLEALTEGAGKLRDVHHGLHILRNANLFSY